jgi:SAM-dependent methyltransferase
LADAGARVLTIDPLIDYGSADPSDSYGSVEPDTLMQELNRAFGTNVDLRRCTIDEAGLPDGSIDTVYCVSTFEHLSSADATRAVAEVGRVLKTGGHLVLTIDLFLDLAPFTRRERNQWGTNIDVHMLVKQSGMELVGGIPAELNGSPEFDALDIQAQLAQYLVGNYPGMAQCLVLKKQ